MKLLCVIDGLNHGGAQRQLVELALGFKEKGHDVSFLTYHHQPFYYPTLGRVGIPITCIQDPSYLGRLLKMRQFIRNGKYEAVVAFLEAASFICEVAGLPHRNWKLVVGERIADPNVLVSPKLRMYRWFHLFADYVVSNSYANMEIVRSINPFLSDAKCKVIYNVVDFDRWRPSPNYVPRKEAKIKIVVAARQEHRKNLHKLIDALALMTKEDLHKLAVDWYGDRGGEPYADFISDQIKAHGLEDVISLHAATRDIAATIQEADAVGLFSFFEGLPNAVCEGMACAKPVVCSTESGMSQFLSHDANLLCSAADPASIKRAICYLLQLSNIQLIEIGKRNEKIAKKNFGKPTIVREYLDVLESRGSGIRDG